MDAVTYEIGNDQKIYAVFKDSLTCEDHEHLFPDHHGVACYGGYENALCIQMLWGQ